MAQGGFGLDSMVNRARETTAAIAEAVRRDKQETPAYTPTPDESEVLALLQEPLRVREYTLETFERIWTKCILYTAGIQHLRQVDNMSRTWRAEATNEWLPMPVVNYIQAKVERATDFFTRNRPTGYVIPNSDDQDDVDAAELAEQVQRYIWQITESDEVYDEAVAWLLTTGNTFVKQFFDVSARPRIKTAQFVETEEPVQDAQGQPIISQVTGLPVTVRKWVEKRDETGNILYDEHLDGEICREVVSPMAITVPLACRKLQRSPWILESELYPVSQIKSMFPRFAPYLSETRQVATSDLMQYKLTSILAVGLHGLARTVDPYLMRGYDVLHHLEYAPSDRYPDGLLLIACGSLPLHIGPLPIKGRFSFEHCGYHRVPGRFWYRGMVEDLIDPQDQINKIEQFYRLNDGYNVNAMWLVPDKANVPDGAFSNRPGKVIRYAYPFKPERESGMSPPPHMVQRRAQYVQDMEELSSVRDVLTGGAPPGVTAGVALNMLGEEAQGGFEPPSKRFERFVERVETSGLELAQRYYRFPRVLEIEGDEGGLQEVKDFIGTKLRGNTRWRVETGSYRPRSRAAEQQNILDAVSQIPGVMELMTDPENVEAVLSRLGISQIKTKEGLDYRRAKWENEMLSRTVGWEQVQRMAGDDDMIHLATHTARRKEKSWLRMPRVVQARHIQHEMEHLQAIVASGGMSEPPKAEAEAEADGIQGPSQPTPTGAGDEQPNKNEEMPE